MGTTVELCTGLPIAEVGPRLFGGFLEHLGRAVYEGVHQPGSAHADEAGFRTDVLEAPNAVRSEPFDDLRIGGGNATAKLPPYSLLAMVLRLG